MSKQLVFDETARQALLAGVSKLARAVHSTLGPRGRNAVLDKGWGSPLVTKDGVTIASEIELEDTFENLGAQLVREAATKTYELAGGGTTTATVLAEAIFREGLKQISGGANPMAIASGLRKATEAATEEIASLAISIDAKNKKEIQQVATIAANNDAAVGSILAEVFLKAGNEGVIIVEEGRGTEITVDWIEGIQFDRGFLSPHFVTNQQDLTVELNDCFVLLYEATIASNKLLIPLLEAVAKAKRPLLIFAESVDGEALATLVVNKIRGLIQACAVKAPGYADRRKAMLEDLAILTGGRPIFRDTGVGLENVTLADLGRVQHVKISSRETVMIGGAGTRSNIDERVRQINDELKNIDSDYDREKLQERVAKLTGGVARIRCGGVTEAEARERKALVENALAGTRAALAEGIVPGGGVALIRSQAGVKRLGLKGDEALGATILHDVLDYPLRTIASNAGQDGALVVNRVMKLDQKNHGYNAVTDSYGDLVDQGIVDPAKVVRTALQSATSVASLLLTTEAMVTDLPKEEEMVDIKGGTLVGQPRRRGTTGPIVQRPPGTFFSEEGRPIPKSPSANQPGRHVNVWIDEPGIASVDTTFTLGVNVGAPKGGVVAGGKLREPDWGRRTELPLLITLHGPGARLKPGWHRAILPKHGEMHAVYFLVTPKDPGPLRLTLTIYLDQEMLLLECYDFVVNVSPLQEAAR